MFFKGPLNGPSIDFPLMHISVKYTFELVPFENGDDMKAKVMMMKRRRESTRGHMSQTKTFC